MLIEAPLFAVAENRRFEIVSAMLYQWGSHVVRVPEGTRTDFASIPRPFRNIFPVNGRHRLPAVLHDYLYQQGGELPDGLRYTRKKADQVFLQFMKEAGVGFLARGIMYRAVRAAGWLHSSWKH